MKLALRTVVSTVLGLLSFAACLFLPAWTFHYWQAWVFIAVFMAASIGSSLYLAVRNPEALRRRMKGGPTAETRPLQRLVMTVIVIAVVLLLVVSALDHRFGWSTVPVVVVVVGDILVAVGLVLAQWVVAQNNYAAATITIEQDQPLVSTGLYGLVRHPMYVGALIMMIGTPLALDSYWGLLAVVPAVLALSGRILDEEKMLAADLAGYRDYMSEVRYRLVPHVW